MSSSSWVDLNKFKICYYWDFIPGLSIAADVEDVEEMRLEENLRWGYLSIILRLIRHVPRIICHQRSDWWKLNRLNHLKALLYFTEFSARNISKQFMKL